MSAPPAPRIPFRSVVAVVRRPSLWWTAVVLVFRLAPDGWWRRRPHLPVPDPAYLHFRLVTAYGGEGVAPPDPQDLVTYLRWCRAWPEVLRRR
jgi:hypothetical protein